MNGLHFQADLLSVHKTGLYLDQQANYQTVAKLLSQWGCKQILDCFTYQGGFALHAAYQAPESYVPHSIKAKTLSAKPLSTPPPSTTANVSAKSPPSNHPPTIPSSPQSQKPTTSKASPTNSSPAN